MPVYLWELGLDLAGLCALLGVSGLAFSVALGPWQRLARGRPLAGLVGVTFALELALVATVLLTGRLLAQADDTGGRLLAAALLVGVANGAYNAFFWSTQRTLFAALAAAGDTGRRYGNLQIVVAVFLKLGILLGGLLVDAGLVTWTLLASAFVGLLATLRLAPLAGSAPLHGEPPVSWRRSLGFRDEARSSAVFAVDGPFLYLESHFWTLSLFLLVREDHSRLGLVVVVLGVLFALLFLLVKNRIDRSAVDTVYRTSVALYALSWLLRVAVDDASPATLTLALLIGVTFCSSLFRLAFNKRFFDVARYGGGALGAPSSPERVTVPGPTAYLVIKSHVSQLSIALVFLPLAALLHASELPPEAVLDGLYVAAAALSLVYLRYRRPATDEALPTAKTTPTRSR